MVYIITITKTQLLVILLMNLCIGLHYIHCEIFIYMLQRKALQVKYSDWSNFTVVRYDILHMIKKDIIFYQCRQTFPVFSSGDTIFISLFFIIGGIGLVCDNIHYNISHKMDI